jgi:hypothetical protein
MSYQLKLKELDVLGEGQFVNAAGKTECVMFVQQATGAPNTRMWKQGDPVLPARIGSIARGTAIATFDANGAYPIDAKGKHAAIYLSHSSDSISVLDQWSSQGRVKARIIRLKKKIFPRSDAAQCYFIIE